MSCLPPHVGHTLGDFVGPCVGKGATGCGEEVGVQVWCPSPFMGQLSCSRVIEEQSEGQHHWGKERRMSPGRATPCHVRKRAVLYAYADVHVRSSEWPILVPFILSENEFTHRPLRSGGDRWHN